MRTVLTGLGFALGFGWAWFASLRELWLGKILSGSLFSGQGESAFFVAMAVVFLCSATGVFRFLSQAHQSQSNHHPRLLSLAARIFTHAQTAPGAAFILALCAVLASCADLPLAAKFPSALLGLAAGISGLWWTRALLSLPPVSALTALAMAAGLVVMPVGLDALLDLTPLKQQELMPLAPAIRPLMLTLCLLAALLLARRLPAEKANSRPKHAPDTALPLWGLTPLAAFFALGALYSAAGADIAKSATACLLEAVALAMAIPFCLAAQRRKASPVFCLSFGAALAACVFLLLFFHLHPLLPRIWPPLLDGFLQGLAVAFLAMRAQESANLTRLAGLALLLLLTVVNAGFLIGVRLMQQGNESLSLDLLAALTAVCLMLTLLPLLLRLWEQQKARQAAKIPEKGGPPKQENSPLSKAELQSLFAVWALTPKERSIATLIRTGLSNPEISSSAGISENTLRIHLKNLYRKTGAADREALKSLLTERTISVAEK